MTQGKRLIFIALIALALLVPLMFTKEIVSERMSLYRSAIQDISSTWGSAQLIKGPFLGVPLEIAEKTTVRNDHGELVERVRIVSRTAVILPERLEITADITPAERARGIYHYTVYTSSIVSKARFQVPDLKKTVDNLHAVLWDRAFLSWGITDLRGVEEARCALEDGGETNASRTPDAGSGFAWLQSGFHVSLAHPEQEKSFSCRLDLRLNGSGGMNFAPIGETSVISVSSPWPHPSFTGEKLPTERTVSDKGFSARWQIPHLARSYPQLFLSGGKENSSVVSQIDRFSVGVALFEPVAYYTLVVRATKYGLLFICLTFVGLIAFEASGGLRMHPLQYGLTGLAMVVFYLVLLSLAEHTGFFWAYMAASATMIAMIGAYVAAALRSVARGLAISLLLAGLYLLLYALLQLEDYALLVGTVLVVAMLATLMYVTRNMGSGRRQPSPPEEHPTAQGTDARP